MEERLLPILITVDATADYEEEVARIAGEAEWRKRRNRSFAAESLLYPGESAIEDVTPIAPSEEPVDGVSPYQNVFSRFAC